MTALNNFKFINSIGEGAQGVVNLYQDIRLGEMLLLNPYIKILLIISY